MRPFHEIERKARRHPRRIVLLEGEDERMIQAGHDAMASGIAKIILLGRPDNIQAKAAALGVDIGGMEIIEPVDSDSLDDYAETYYRLRRHRNVTREQAREAATEPLNFGNLMVRMGDADGSVGGAVYATAETVRSAIQIIGLAPGSRLVSSFFLMMFCEDHHQRKGGMIFTDCGLVIDPSAEELADIAVGGAGNARALLGVEPKVAMLSFSTNSSAQHPRVSKVAAATAMVRQRMPDLMIDGEVQLDAGIVPGVSEKKLPGSRVRGEANVLVFPSLEAGNIGYKLAERIGGAKAIGPILQGLMRPANDLSRGCSPEDIYRLIAVTVVQAQSSDVDGVPCVPVDGSALGHSA